MIICVRNVQVVSSIERDTRWSVKLALATSVCAPLAHKLTGLVENADAIGVLIGKVEEPLAIHGATAALEDKGHFEATQAAIREGRTYLYQQLDKLGLSYIRSQSNFMVVHVGDAKKIADDLAKQNVYVRNADRNWGVKNHIRVSIGTREENEAFINTLRQISG